MKKIWETAKKWGKLAWTVVGVLVVFLAIWSAYDQYYKKPDIFSQIVGEINVLDINEPLKELQILFQGDNIQEKSLNLRIYRVRIENVGGTNIIQNDFDQGDSWGIKIEKGRIIETRLVSSNSKYIDTNLSPSVQTDNIVKFNKIIFDKGDFFVVELLVLHSKDVPPILYRIGKIAGIQESESEIFAPEYSEPFLTALFRGNWLIQVIRFILYFIASVALFIGVLVLYIKFDEKKKKTAQNPQLPQQPS